MPKQTLAQKSVYWLKVISLGLILGLGVQFAKAWTPPTVAPPGGNVSGPLTTSGVAQYKTGKLGVNSNAPLGASYAFEVRGASGLGNAFVDWNIDAGGSVTALWDVVAGRDITARRNSYAGNAFAAPWICIGSDCRNVWPSGGGGGGDNLGNHTATMALNMNSNNISAVNSIAVSQICLSGDCKSAWPSGGGSTGTLTSLSAGTGITLSPNPITTTGTISADTSVLQKRVTGTCSVGSAVTSIKADGTVGCGAAGGGSGTIVAGCGLGFMDQWEGAPQAGNCWGGAREGQNILGICPAGSTSRVMGYSQQSSPMNVVFFCTKD